MPHENPGSTDDGNELIPRPFSPELTAKLRAKNLSKRKISKVLCIPIHSCMCSISYACPSRITCCIRTLIVMQHHLARGMSVIDSDLDEELED